MADDGWGFADMYSMDGKDESSTEAITDVQSDDWRNLLVLGRATGKSVHYETLALIGHARYLADELGCRVEVLLIGADLDAAVEEIKKYPVDTVYTVDAPDYAPIDHTARVLEQVVRKRRPELVLVFQSRSGDAITAYAASRLGTGFVIGATKVEMDTAERLAVVTHRGSDGRFQMVTRMTRQPQFVSVQQGLFRAPMEDPYRTTNTHALEVDAGKLATVEVLERQDPPERTVENADRVVVAGSRIHSSDDIEAARRLADTLDAVFAVTRSVVDRGLADGPVVGRLDHHTKPRLLVAVGCSGALEFLEGVEADTLIAISSGAEDPINQLAAYRVAGPVQDAVEAVLGAL